MGATVAQVSIEVIERSDPAEGPGGDARRRSSAETDADRVRRQQYIRRKTKLARGALAAHRTRGG
jgi:hypothetical protein